MATTKARGPKRSQEQIEADLTAQLARIGAKKKVGEWAARKAETLSQQASTDLGDQGADGLRALSKLLAAQAAE